MSQNQLPKATMSNFIRDRIKDKKKISADFTNFMLDLSREFIDKVSARAKDICEKQGKKTISNEHLYKSLEELGMSNSIPNLQNLNELLKMKQQKKQEVKKQVQENIERRNKEQEERVEENVIPASVLISSRHYQKQILIEDDEEDFQNLLDEEEN